MSTTANWSYTNVAQVRPVLGRDKYGEALYGEVFEIACTWKSESENQTGLGGQGGASGVERIARHTIYTEDPRPKYGDQLMFDGSDGWETIWRRTGFDMSFFGEIPDYTLVT